MHQTQDLTNETSHDLLKMGTQIVSVPLHAYGDVNHPDSQSGFVTSLSKNGQTAFCRYWKKDQPGVLRTLANSEGTYINSIAIEDTVKPSVVAKAIRQIMADEEELHRHIIAGRN